MLLVDLSMAVVNWYRATSDSPSSLWFQGPIQATILMWNNSNSTELRKLECVWGINSYCFVVGLIQSGRHKTKDYFEVF